jgi:hypothetical protein
LLLRDAWFVLRDPLVSPYNEGMGQHKLKRTTKPEVARREFVKVTLWAGVVSGIASRVPDAVIYVANALSGSTGAAVVAATSTASVVIATSSYVSAKPAPTVIFRLHPDDERTGP